MTLRALISLNCLSAVERDEFEGWIMVVAEFTIH